MTDLAQTIAALRKLRDKLNWSLDDEQFVKHALPALLAEIDRLTDQSAELYAAQCEAQEKVTALMREYQDVAGMTDLRAEIENLNSKLKMKEEDFRVSLESSEACSDRLDMETREVVGFAWPLRKVTAPLDDAHMVTSHDPSWGDAPSPNAVARAKELISANMGQTYGILVRGPDLALAIAAAITRAVEEERECIRALKSENTSVIDQLNALSERFNNDQTALAVCHRDIKTLMASADKLEADNERLREALKPFADHRIDLSDGLNLSDWGGLGITVGDLRRARAALAETTK